MPNIETSYYKGFSVQALIYRHSSGEGRTHERLYDVSIRIGRDDDPAHATAVFKLALDKPFMNFGDARRAGEAHARQIINGNVPGASLEQLGNDPKS